MTGAVWNDAGRRSHIVHKCDTARRRVVCRCGLLSPAGTLAFRSRRPSSARSGSRLANGSVLRTCSGIGRVGRRRSAGTVDVRRTSHNSTWRIAASTLQTLLVASICAPPAAIGCSYRDTGVPCSVGRRVFSVAGPAACMELYLPDPSRSFECFCRDSENFPFPVIVYSQGRI